VGEFMQVLLLGVIEGVTEFLPVSSTGHLLIAQRWLGARSDLFNTVIQTGAVLAVVLIFTGRIRQLLFQWREPAARDYILKLLVAFSITCVGGLLLKNAGFQLPDAARPVALATLIGGVLFLIVERWLHGRRTTDHVTWLAAVAVAFGQLLAAVFPGASRSGSTILMALCLGVNRPAATEFSFLLGIPTLLAAGLLQIYSSIKEPTATPEDWGMVGVAWIAAAVTAFVTVKWLLRFVQTHTFEGFGWYRILLGSVLLILAV
jgi:undecaprenyl-diphosphatase